MISSISLAARLSFLVVGILGVSALVSGVVFHSRIRRDIAARLERRLDARLDWVRRGVSVADGALAFRPGAEPRDAADAWRIERIGGTVLWSRGPEPGEGAPTRSFTFTLEHWVEGEEVVAPEDVPEKVLETVRDHLPSFDPRHVERRVRNLGSLWTLDGVTGGEDYRLLVRESSDGRIGSTEVWRRRERRDRSVHDLASAPPAVREAARRELGDAAVRRISVGVDGGREIWEIEAGDGERAREVDIAEDGTVVGRESALSFPELPDAVRATVERILEGRQPDEVKLRTRGDVEVYDVELDTGGQEIDLSIAGSGILLEKDIDWRDGREDALDIDRVPVAVRETVTRELGGAAVEVWGRVRDGGVVVYDVEGELEGRPVEIGSIHHRRLEIDADELPFAVRDAARREVGDLPVERAISSIRGGTVIYDLELARGDDTIELHFREDGERVERDRFDAYPSYHLPPGKGRTELRAIAATDDTAARAELARVSRALWTVGPLAVGLAGLAVALLVRWQLRPLRRMAGEASRVGPADPDARITPAGGSREYAELRNAVNGMLERMGEGLRRERRFAAAAAHELRTPLAQIRTTIEVALRRERPLDEYREALGDLLEDTGRLERVVEGLLELARSADARAVSGRPVHLREVLRRAEAEHLLSGTAQAEIFVDGVEDLLAAAFRNVLANARHHAGDPSPTIDVADTGGGMVRVAIADRGAGVPRDLREQIFEPLTRFPSGSDRTSKENDGRDGFGLGLAIARSTVRAFGGDLIARDRPDGRSGAEFVFSLRKAPSGPLTGEEAPR